MPTFTVVQARQNFGTFIDVAMKQPVKITRHGRVILEVMTPHEKERVIQEREKERLFSWFVVNAVEAHEHYETTGLHATHDEMRAWVNSLFANPKNKPPKLR